MKLFPNRIKKFYKFVESPLLDRTAIKIVKGPFEGVIYTYGDCSFKGNDDDNTLTSSFQYTIVENNKTISTASFEKLIGDILMDIVKDQVENGTLGQSIEKEIEARLQE